jgi:hypothetical protein
MNKSELIKWLEEHPGWEFEKERNRLIEEHKELALEIVRDSIRDIVQNFCEMMDKSVEHDIEEKIEGMVEFPEVQDYLKRF